LEDNKARTKNSKGVKEGFREVSKGPEAYQRENPGKKAKQDHVFSGREKRLSSGIKRKKGTRPGFWRRRLSAEKQSEGESKMGNFSDEWEHGEVSPQGGRKEKAKVLTPVRGRRDKKNKCCKANLTSDAGGKGRRGEGWQILGGG